MSEGNERIKGKWMWKNMKKKKNKKIEKNKAGLTGAWVKKHPSSCLAVHKNNGPWAPLQLCFFNIKYMNLRTPPDLIAITVWISKNLKNSNSFASLWGAHKGTRLGSSTISSKNTRLYHQKGELQKEVKCQTSESGNTLLHQTRNSNVQAVSTELP